ncbi:MAG: MerR family transcriptional regulator [Bryobacterales bacterium]|nr:MerR family transcriptional regulator [Bryobacterales bacterium]
MGEHGGLSRKGASPKSASAVSTPAGIPDKLVFRIGEVSRIVGVEPYVLRYWETEFSQLAPKKSGTGHRMYRRREVEQLLLIRQLLYDRQYTIKGARQYLKELGQRRPHAVEDSPAESMRVVSMPVPAESASSVAMDTDSSGNGTPTSAEAVTIDGLRQELRSILTLLE